MKARKEKKTSRQPQKRPGQLYASGFVAHEMELPSPTDQHRHGGGTGWYKPKVWYMWRMEGRDTSDAPTCRNNKWSSEISDTGNRCWPLGQLAHALCLPCRWLNLHVKGAGGGGDDVHVYSRLFSGPMSQQTAASQPLRRLAVSSRWWANLRPRRIGCTKFSDLVASRIVVQTTPISII